MRISDCSADVCSSDLRKSLTVLARIGSGNIAAVCFYDDLSAAEGEGGIKFLADNVVPPGAQIVDQRRVSAGRTEEHTSELQSLMSTSYAVFCLKKKNNKKNTPQPTTTTDKTRRLN